MSQDAKLAEINARLNESLTKSLVWFANVKKLLLPKFAARSRADKTLRMYQTLEVAASRFAGIR